MRAARSLTVGWVSLLIGVLVPSFASIEAMRLFWTGRCAGTIHWTAAPLLAGCEPLSPVRVILGWTATIVYVTALIVAAVIAVCAAATFSRARDKRQAVSFVLFPAATGPDRRGNAIGAWIVGASFTGLTTCVGAGLFSLAVRFIVLRNRRREPNSGRLRS